MFYKKGGYCSIFRTAGKHHYMLYPDFSNIKVLSQNFNNSALKYKNKRNRE